MRLLAVGFAAVAVAVLFLGTATAGAHSALLRSEPAANSIVAAAPQRIVLEFTEAPELRFARYFLYDASGQSLADGMLRQLDGSTTVLYFEPPPLADGTHTVAWRVVSTVDGHETQGAFAFSIGEQTAAGPVDPAFDTGGPPKAISVFSRWATFITTSFAVGLVSFVPLVLWPVLRRENADSDIRQRASKVFTRAWLSVLVAALLAAVLALLMQAWRSAGSLGDGFEAIPDIVTDSRFGYLFIARVAVIGLLLEIAVLFGRRLFSPDRSETAIWLLVGGVTLALPATISLNSHAASGEELTVIATIGDWLHQVGAGVWIGGLFAFVLSLRVVLPAITDEQRSRLLSIAIPRFSALAIGAVAVIIGTGVLQWAVRIGNLNDTLDNGYGQSLIAKTLLLLPMLALGAANLFIASPRFRAMVRSASEISSKAPKLTGAFRSSVALELTLGIGILLATAFMTDTSPPNAVGAAPQPGVVASMTVNDLEIGLNVNPGRPGDNTTTITLRDTRGAKEQVTNLIVRFSSLEESLGEHQETPPAASENVYRIQGLQFSLPGRWQITVIVQRAGVEDAHATFDIEIDPE